MTVNRKYLMEAMKRVEKVLRDEGIPGRIKVIVMPRKYLLHDAVDSYGEPAKAHYLGFSQFFGYYLVIIHDTFQEEVEAIIAHEGGNLGVIFMENPQWKIDELMIDMYASVFSHEVGHGIVEKAMMKWQPFLDKLPPDFEPPEIVMMGGKANYGEEHLINEFSAYVLLKTSKLGFNYKIEPLHLTAIETLISDNKHPTQEVLDLIDRLLEPENTMQLIEEWAYDFTREGIMQVLKALNLDKWVL